MNFIGVCGVDWIIEAHCVQEMPSGWTPQVDNHAVVAVVVFQSEDFFILDCYRDHIYTTKETLGFLLILPLKRNLRYSTGYDAFKRKKGRD
jgi:hypothetical protein